MVAPEAQVLERRTADDRDGNVGVVAGAGAELSLRIQPPAVQGAAAIGEEAARVAVARVHVRKDQIPRHCPRDRRPLVGSVPEAPFRSGAPAVDGAGVREATAMVTSGGDAEEAVVTRDLDGTSTQRGRIDGAAPVAPGTPAEADAVRRPAAGVAPARRDGRVSGVAENSRRDIAELADRSHPDLAGHIEPPAERLRLRGEAARVKGPGGHLGKGVVTPHRGRSPDIDRVRPDPDLPDLVAAPAQDPASGGQPTGVVVAGGNGHHPRRIAGNRVGIAGHSRPAPGTHRRGEAGRQVRQETEGGGAGGAAHVHHCVGLATPEN